VELNKLIKGIRNRRRLKSGYIFVPYILAESTPTIISGSFSPKSLLKSRYSTTMVDNKYYK